MHVRRRRNSLKSPSLPPALQRLTRTSLAISPVQAAVTKNISLGAYTVRIYFSQVWRLEVQDQGCSDVW